MTYSEVKAAFTGILNRRDITPSQITLFLQMGVQYVQRKLRIPPMEKLMNFTSIGENIIPVPGDYLEVIAIYTNDTTSVTKLEKRDLQTVLRASIAPGPPIYYHRSGSSFIVAPTPAVGNTISVNYYSDATALTADTDHNWMTDAAPTIMVYGGLRYASDFFLDDRKASFKATLDEELFDLQEMANRDELVNASVSPLYSDQIEAL